MDFDGVKCHFIGWNVQLQVIAGGIMERIRTGHRLENQFLDEGGDVVIADHVERVGFAGIDLLVRGQIKPEFIIFDTNITLLRLYSTRSLNITIITNRVPIAFDTSKVCGRFSEL